MKKKIIFGLVFVFLFTTTIVFAAFKFIEVINNTGKSAGLTCTSSLISYQDTNYSEYRTDMAYKVEVELKRGTKYVETEDTTYQKDKNYYSKGDDNTYSLVDPKTYTTNSAITSTLYELISTYIGLSGINSVVTKTATIDSSNYTVTTDSSSLVNKLTIKVDTDNSIELSEFYVDDNGLESIKIDNSQYRTVVDASKKAFLILDTKNSTYSTIYEKDNAGNTTTTPATKVTCRATNDVVEGEENNIYLNQLGIKIDITTEIECYVRINIEDAWIRTREYATNTETKYIPKDQIDGDSPFKQSGSDYYYDSATNIIYLKTVIKPVLNEDGSFGTASLIFNVNEGYFYTAENQVVYQDYIKVELTYHVDIVQANRVQAVWGLDPSNL